MLSAFTPTKGPKAGKKYYLPDILTGSDVRAGAIDDDVQELDGQSGGYSASGMNPAKVGPAPFALTFDIFGDWLLKNANGPYTADVVGRDKAIDDFISSVLMGGVGTLEDKSGSQVKTTEAKAVGPYSITRISVTHAQIACQITIMSGMWRTPTGLIYAG